MSSSSSSPYMTPIGVTDDETLCCWRRDVINYSSPERISDCSLSSPIVSDAELSSSWTTITANEPSVLSRLIACFIGSDFVADFGFTGAEGKSSETTQASNSYSPALPGLHQTYWFPDFFYQLKDEKNCDAWHLSTNSLLSNNTTLKWCLFGYLYIYVLILNTFFCPSSIYLLLNYL